MTASRAYSYIRFSTPEQEKGDSLRRQMEASAKYATEHGLALDDSTRMTDRGLSAYKGEHRRRGALGEFLKLVEGGRIPRGSVLLVEHLDRLSREDVDDAYDQFRSLIKAGIKVVTLGDGMEYDAESLKRNWVGLIISIVYMAQAHDASLMKADRVAGAWQTKREKARTGERKLTARCPAWLELSEDGTAFKVDEGRAAVVRRIYEMRAGGIGSATIEHALNSDPHIWRPGRTGGKGGWRRQYIIQILRNPAVIGLYQPHRKVKSKWEPAGEPIPNYYPAVVTPELFYRVQDAITRNRETAGQGGGRTGKVRNLFTHIVKCSKCRGPVAILNNGRDTYLVCDSARRRAGCDNARTVRYDAVESLVLDHCKGLKAEDILPAKRQSAAAKARDQVDAATGELTTVESKVQRLVYDVENTESREVRAVLHNRLKVLLDNQARLEKRKAAAEVRASALSQSAETVEQQLMTIRELMEHIKGLPETEAIELRLQLRSELRKLLRAVIIVPPRNRKDYHSGAVALLFTNRVEARLLSLETGAVIADVPPKRFIRTT